jgi:hypothetical protein
MNPQIEAAVSFLNNYADNHSKRQQNVSSLEERANKLKPVVDEYRRLNEQINNLKNHNRSEEKFLIKMKDMIEQNTDSKVVIGDPTLFDQKKESESDAE